MIKSVLISILALISLASAANRWDIEFINPTADTKWRGASTHTIEWQLYYDTRVPDGVSTLLFLYQYPRSLGDGFTSILAHSFDINSGSIEVSLSPEVYGYKRYILELLVFSSKEKETVVQSEPFYIDIPQYENLS
ncbi:hypothetical protein BDF14DRAFT_1843132 [Spinellus fusiger]|nr:hypothetical protein BDF14DRAFT_1843132 [Spinellus fusiger]